MQIKKDTFTVLSLFDGIGGGITALKKANIKIDKYYASEIEDSSMKIAIKNHPEISHIGDCRFIDYKSLPTVDLLIGGSPCQNFSFAGKMNGMSTKESIEVKSLEEYLELKKSNFEFDGFSYLFWEYVYALKTVNPKYFLLENVNMSKKWEEVITNALGVKPLKLNSELTSAQDRVRLYWTNIPNITFPKNTNIFIDDILEKCECKILGKHRQEYSNYDTSKVDKTIHKNTPIQLGSSKQFKCSVRSNGKAFTVRKAECNGIILENGDIRKYTITEVERLFNFPDGYTECEGVSNTKRYEALGNGWDMGMLSHLFSHLNEK